MSRDNTGEGWSGWCEKIESRGGTSFRDAEPSYGAGRCIHHSWKYEVEASVFVPTFDHVTKKVETRNRVRHTPTSVIRAGVSGI